MPFQGLDVDDTLLSNNYGQSINDFFSVCLATISSTTSLLWIQREIRVPAGNARLVDRITEKRVNSSNSVG